jgi:hypothetical protein
MPVEKFGRTDEKVTQHTPTVTSSIGLMMGQINNVFIRRDGNNVMSADLNMNRHRVINLSAPTVADDAVTSQYADDMYLKRDGSSAVAGVVDMSNNHLMNLGDPLGVQDAVNLRHLDRLLKLDGSTVMAGAINMGGHMATNVGQPASAGDVVTKGYADNVVGLTHLDMRGHKIETLKEPTAWSDAVTKGFVESLFTNDLNMHEHKISNVSDPVGAQDVMTLAFTDAHYLKHGSELDMKSQRITNLAEPTQPQDAATLNYVNSVLARKKLFSDLFIFTRSTSTPLELNLSDTAGPTSKFVFVFYTPADDNMSHIASKSTHIVSAFEPNDPINHVEFINLTAYNRQHETYTVSIAIRKFIGTSKLIIIDRHLDSRFVSLKVDVFISLA